MPVAETWRTKRRTAAAIAILCWARLLVAWVPFDRWRNSLGFEANGSDLGLATQAKARRLAADIEWAARRLPVSTKCLPRAMALSWMLRRQRIGHAVVIAVRPPDLRELPDAFHAWIEVGGAKIIGDLPGPWLETLRIGT